VCVCVCVCTRGKLVFTIADSLQEFLQEFPFRKNNLQEFSKIPSQKVTRNSCKNLHQADKFLQNS
jgi:hypothetical protein